MTSNTESIEKLRHVREMMEKEGIDALSLGTTANFAWLTCGGRNYVGTATETGAAVILITRKTQVIICDNIEARRIQEEEVAGQGYEFIVSDWHSYSRSDVIDKAAGRGRLVSDIPVPGAYDASPLMDSCRAGLCDEEIERYRALGRDTGVMLSKVAHEIRPGMSEHQIAAAMDAAVVEMGAVATVNLVAADERIALYRHPIPTDKRLDRAALLVIGVRKWGLIVSASRMVHFGPLSEDLRRRHDAVCHVDAAMISATRPGEVVGAIVSTGIEMYAKAGFADEWKLHHQGGPTGYKGRDFRATPGSTAKVRRNQAFAWNPSITGTKSEDTMIAMQSGPEIISASPDWPMIDVTIGHQTIRRPDILVR